MTTTITLLLSFLFISFVGTCSAKKIDHEDPSKGLFMMTSDGIQRSNPKAFHTTTMNVEAQQQQIPRQQHAQKIRGILPSLRNQEIIVTSDETTNGKSSSSLVGGGQQLQRPEEGVQVSRSITKLMSDAAFYVDVVQDLDNKAEDPCANHDVYGSNDCHLQWASVVTVNYTVQVNSTIVKGDTLEGHFTLDRFLPWKFSCPLCGEDCELQFPILPLNYTIVMPPCPVAPHTVTHTLEHHLWEHSPTKGLVTTHLEGTVHLIRGSTQESIAEFGVTVTVR